jgi:hypothetical protein
VRGVDPSCAKVKGNSRAMPLLPLWAFVACYRVNFAFYDLISKLIKIRPDDLVLLYCMWLVRQTQWNKPEHFLQPLFVQGLKAVRIYKVELLSSPVRHVYEV